eukprot:2373304-Amphidinium_carterae.1
MESLLNSPGHAPKLLEAPTIVPQKFSKEQRITMHITKTTLWLVATLAIVDNNNQGNNMFVLL